MKPGRTDPDEPDRLMDLMKMCPEAQADGVPCPEVGRACEICERALRSADRQDPSNKPDPPVSR